MRQLASFILYLNRVLATSENQRKIEGIFPVREKSGNFHFLKTNQGKVGEF